MLPTTLENLHEGGGFSGTDTSMLEIAGGLATRNHGVRILAGGPAAVSRETPNLSYLSPERTFLDTQLDLARVDVLVVVYMMPEAPAHAEMMDVLRRLTNPRLRVFCWCHVIFQQAHIALLENACLHRNLQLTLVCVSDFVRAHLSVHHHDLVVIPNAVNPDIFLSEDPGEREPRSLVFSASYERGGRLAEAVHTSLLRTHGPIGAMHLCSYCDALIPSLSKKALASRLRGCDYMVYPLVLDNGSVHHDTYACVVLEAMASGVLVVSWDVACMRAVYGDLITLVSPPPWPGYDGQAAGGSNPGMLEAGAVAALADAVSQLMALPTATREARREVAQAWALSQTWGARVDALESECFKGGLRM